MRASWKNSCIKEALRIGKVTDHRLSLIARNEDLKYERWIIPAGVSSDLHGTRLLDTSLSLTSTPPTHLDNCHSPHDSHR